MTLSPAPNRPKPDDKKWDSIHSDTPPFLIVDFRRFRVGQMVHFILRQFLIGKYGVADGTSTPRFWLCLIGSFFLAAFGQPAWISGLGMFTSVGGYALFWIAMLRLIKRKNRFLLALFWYIAVQAIQLSWMTSI